MTLIIIILGLVLILFNIRFLGNGDGDGKAKKPSSSPDLSTDLRANEKAGFRKIYEDEEMDTSAVDIIIGELRVEFSETILELQKEILELNGRIDSLSSEVESLKSIPQTQMTGYSAAAYASSPPSQFVNRLDNESNVRLEEEPSSLNHDMADNKMKEIGRLLKKGHSVEELCEKYQMGRGEILLIEKLYRK